MPTLTLEGLGTLELDSNGRVDCDGFGPARREEVSQRVRIVREKCIRDVNATHSYFRACIDGHDCSGRTVDEVCRAFAQRAVTVDYVDDPVGAAHYACAVLAADKGIPSRIEKIDRATFDVVTDEGKRFRFCGR